MNMMKPFNSLVSRTRLLTAFAAAAIATTATADPTIGQVVVRQQWPWSTDVYVEYSITGVTAPVDITISAFNGSTALDSAAVSAASSGAIHGISADGVYSFTIDPVAAFGTGNIAMTSFRVALGTTPSPAYMDEVLYKIFDLDDGSCENVTRAQLLNGEKGSIETDYSKIGTGFSTSLSDVIIWTGVTNDVAYKTSKLVMRKVPAKNVTWRIGTPSSDERLRTLYEYAQNETQHDVILTHDYFIGVFEVTQAQWVKIKEAHSSFNRTSENAAWRPVNQLSYKGVRGGRGELQNGEGIFWPTNSYKHLVKDTSFCGLLRAKTGVDFDLPTEAEWEFACRAGTTSTLYSGKNVTGEDQQSMNAVKELAWCIHNSPQYDSSNRNQQPVGMLKPNAFGLYDMLGNALEWCLDWCVDDISLGASDPLVDPDGGSTPPWSTSNNAPLYSRRVRGGCMNYPYFTQRCSFKDSKWSQDDGMWSPQIGCRLTCPVGTTWE